MDTDFSGGGIEEISHSVLFCVILWLGFDNAAISDRGSADGYDAGFTGIFSSSTADEKAVREHRRDSSTLEHHFLGE